jgi:ADP-ribosyl cyclase
VLDGTGPRGVRNPTDPTVEVRPGTGNGTANTNPASTPNVTRGSGGSGEVVGDLLPNGTVAMRPAGAAALPAPSTAPAAGNGTAVATVVNTGGTPSGQPALTASGSFATQPNTAYFWSGMGRGGDTTAAGIAGSQGGTTLEVVMAQRGINLPAWDAGNPSSVLAWRNASQAYANAASGDVRVVLGANVNPGSVWNTVELPALQSNGNVTRIIQVDPVTRRETVIFRR